MRHEYATARARNPHHIGAARRIREELARANVPLSVYKLQLVTGLKAGQVRRALSDLCNVTGGVVSQRGPKGVCHYSLYKAAIPDSAPVAGDEFRIAGRITIPQFRYGGTRLG